VVGEPQRAVGRRHDRFRTDGWDKPKRSGTVLNRVVAKSVPLVATVLVSCRGRGCPFTSKKVRHRHQTVNMTRLFRHRRLRPRTVVEVRITARDRIGKVSRLTIRKAKPPLLETLCLPAGASKPERCR